MRIRGEDDRVNSLVTGEHLKVVSTAGGLESGLAVDDTAVGASENRQDLPGFLPGVPDQETLNPGQEYRSHDFGTGFLQQDQHAGSSRQSEEKEFSLEFLEGLSFGRLGSLVFGQLLEVLPLRSKSTGGRSNSKLFPLPTSKELLQITFPSLTLDEVSWLLLVHFALNSVWGGELFSQGPISAAQRSCILELIVDVKRVCSLEGSLERFDWGSFFKHRSVDYQGEEVKVAKSFRWCNIAPALPKEVASVPPEDVCTLGAKHYVEHFDLYLKDQEDWPPVSKPRVMVADEDWGEVCAGLVASKVCTFITRDEVFHVAGEPLVNGMFGVSKEEVHEGVEVYRLIMNLIPLNSLCCPITGDVNTLPNWALMNPLVLQPHENLVVSSEDVRCFFYVMRVPGVGPNTWLSIRWCLRTLFQLGCRVRRYIWRRGSCPWVSSTQSALHNMFTGTWWVLRERLTLLSVNLGRTSPLQLQIQHGEFILITMTSWSVWKQLRLALFKALWLLHSLPLGASTSSGMSRGTSRSPPSVKQWQRFRVLWWMVNKVSLILRNRNFLSTLLALWACAGPSLSLSARYRWFAGAWSISPCSGGRF